MALRPRRRRLSLLVRTLVLAVALAGAPVGLAAEGAAPGDRPRSAEEIDGELERARAEQARLAEQVAAQEREAAQLEALQGEVAGEIERTAAALEAVNADLTAVRRQVDLTAGRIEVVKARYAQLVGELRSLDAQLADLVAREEEKRVELQDRQRILADRLRAANDTDRTSLLETFLSGQSFSDVLAEVSYHLDIGTQDTILAERISRDKETLATLRATIEATRTQTNVVRQQTAVQKEQLDVELAVLEATRERLAELEAETARQLEADRAAFEELARTRTDVHGEIERAQAAQADLAASIAALVEEEERRRAEEARRIEEERRRAEARRLEEARRLAEARRAAEAQRIEAQSRLGNIPSAYNGTFMWPLIGRITGEWGCSGYPGYGPGGPGCVHYHNGIDITRGCGSNIVAAGDGTVAFVGWNWADGPDPAWMVVIAHSRGLNTWYAHMAPSAPRGIRVGARVKAGQVIGQEGNTGRSTGCHLHWMVELNGQFVNGRLFL